MIAYLVISTIAALAVLSLGLPNSPLSRKKSEEERKRKAKEKLIYICISCGAVILGLNILMAAVSQYQQGQQNGREKLLRQRLNEPVVSIFLLYGYEITDESYTVEKKSDKEPEITKRFFNLKDLTSGISLDKVKIIEKVWDEVKKIKKDKPLPLKLPPEPNQSGPEPAE